MTFVFWNFLFSDIDECTTGQHNCDVPERAICNNTHGSFLCHCRHGYCGEDGQNCKGNELKQSFFWQLQWHEIFKIVKLVLRVHDWTRWLLIPKTIGNRKGDCAGSCLNWQTQPEKICKLQRTDQCPFRKLYWYVLCILLIFSGCVCHLEQLHAQSHFLFPVVFGINMMPFFRYWLSTRCPLFWYALLYLSRCAVATVAVCGFGGWALVFHCGLPRQVSPSFPNTTLKQKCAPRWEKA